MYYGDFTSKTDVCKQFGIPDFDGTVIFAAYEYEDYSGSAEVIFVHDGKIWMVSGSHCSCYGLEGQFDPVEMSLEGLRHIVVKGNGMLSQFKESFSEAYETIEGLNLEGASTDVVTMALKLAFG